MAFSQETTQIEKFALAFIAVIRQRLPNDTLEDIDDENTARLGTDKEHLCSTDDHCDANDAMLEAFSRCGWSYSDIDWGSEKQAQLWTAVWTTAKMMGFADDLWWCDGCEEDKSDSVPTGINDDATTYCPACQGVSS